MDRLTGVRYTKMSMKKPLLTDEEIIADLKQFIVTTVSQATADLATKNELETGLVSLRAEMEAGFAHVDKRFNDVDARFDDMDEKLNTIADAHAEWLADHENRIKALEKQAA